MILQVSKKKNTRSALRQSGGGEIHIPPGTPERVGPGRGIMKIIFLGDSLVYGYKIPRSSCWTGQIARRLPATVINQGINGESTGGMLARFQHDVIDEHPRFVFLLGGVNDCLMDVPLGVIKSNIASMVFQAVSKMITPIIGIHIPICPDMAAKNWSPRMDFNKTAARVALYRQWIKEFAEDFEVQYIDFYELFENKTRGVHGALEDAYLDGLHPTEEGYGWMTDHWLRSFTRMLAAA